MALKKNANILTEKKPLEKVEENAEAMRTLVSECETHESDSYQWLGPMRATWDDKEAMLLGKSEDKLSKTVKSKVYDPVLSTANIERSARVMAQPPSGKAYAVSKDDLGKNLLMNLLLRHFNNNANEEYSLLLKYRFSDVYSNVYGSHFGLVPWRVNRVNGYIGPEFLNINMRDVRPQPGKKNIDKSDWFGVRSVVSLDWLGQQDPGIWMNVDNLQAEMKAKKSSGDDKPKNSDDQSFIERERFPNQRGDFVYPGVEIFTEYRNDTWITWTPRQVDNDKSRPWVLRLVKNPYPKGYLPIVVKHAFPLLDSMIGLGEFERGKTLQYALNSLINLYLEGVKYAIFPPLHINLANVTASSIKWGAGEKWYMNNPNADVQTMRTNSTEWINTFQSTYGFLMSALQNLSGSSVVASPAGAGPNLGRTPEALKQYGFKESARDEWDRFMMEDMIKQVYDRWTALIVNKLDVPITMRVFGPEVKEIQDQYPKEKILTMFTSKNRGNLTLDKSKLTDGKKGADGKVVTEDTRYDFELESGSTMKRSMADEGEVAGDIIKDFVAAPVILQKIKEEGGDVKFSELYKRRLIGGGIKDWDKIIVMPPTGGPTMAVTPTAPTTVPSVAPGGPTMTPPGPGGAPTETIPAPTTPAPGGGAPQFKDKDISAAALKILGGTGGIPAAAPA